MLLVFFFNDPSPTEIYTLSLHDALPISLTFRDSEHGPFVAHHYRYSPSMSTFLVECDAATRNVLMEDRKSTRLNSSHANISYAVFCLKKKKNITKTRQKSTHGYQQY